MAEKLTPAAAAQARYNSLVARLLDQAESDFDVAEVSKLATRLVSVEEGLALLEAEKTQPGTLARHEWTRAELIVAIDAKRSKKDAPYYLHMAHERHLSRVRARSEKDDSPEAQGYVIPVPDEDVREVDQPAALEAMDE